jgi:hypothetical protein
MELNIYYTSSLLGGLGNQLFNIASVWGIAEANNCKYTLTKDSLTSECFRHCKTFYNELYDRFMTDKQITWEEEFKEYRYQDALKYSPPKESIKKNTRFYGYFQSPKYFENIKYKVLDWIIPKDFKIPGLEKTCFIHIRIGDYQQHKHLTLDLREYYNKCISMLPEDTDFVITTNDLPNTIKMYPNIINKCKGRILTEQDPLTVIRTMAFAGRGVIAANSSFSWWGSYLGYLRAGTKSYLPTPWFSDQSYYYEDIYYTGAEVVPVTEQYNFIIPYRDREQHLKIFMEKFSSAYQGKDCKFYFIHQYDNRTFNRGAMKNIGFLEAVKERPNGIFIFNDIDTYPTYDGSINYNTKKGEVRHPAFLYKAEGQNIGNICCFWKEEFEKVNGFPNYWGWGMEDITIMHRLHKEKIHIDESDPATLNGPRCICLNHIRDPKQEANMHINGKDSDKNKYDDKVYKNGISSLEYKVIDIIDMGPRMKMYNINFDVLDIYSEKEKQDYINNFKELSPMNINEGLLGDFKLFMLSKKVFATSTYSWMASYLSDIIQEVHIPYNDHFDKMQDLKDFSDNCTVYKNVKF